MIKNTLIIVLLLLVIYLYYQNRKLKGLPATADSSQTIYELDEDLIADKDEAIRKKNEAEQEALSLSNKLKLKNQEVSRKESEITRLKQEKSQIEISLNEKIKELKTKYSKKSQQLDKADLESNRLIEQITRLETKITELEKERSELLEELSKHQDLDDFQTWLNKDKNRQNNLPDWDKVIQEIKNKVRNYHLQKSSWSGGWLKSNWEYWQIFEKWLNSAD